MLLVPHVNPERSGLLRMYGAVDEGAAEVVVGARQGPVLTPAARAARKPVKEVIEYIADINFIGVDGSSSRVHKGELERFVVHAKTSL